MKRIDRFRRPWLQSEANEDFFVYARELQRLRSNNVFLAVRNHYEKPNAKVVKKFLGDSLLECFHIQILRELLEPNEIDDVDEVEDAEEGGLSAVWLIGVVDLIRYEGFQIPRSHEDLLELLRRGIYAGDSLISHSPEAFSVITDDDEIELAIFGFTDRWAKENPHKTAFLIHADEKLPSNWSIEGSYTEELKHATLLRSGTGEGTTYLQHFEVHEGNNLSEPSSHFGVVQGIRLPDLIKHSRNVLDEFDEYGCGFWGLFVELQFSRYRKLSTFLKAYPKINDADMDVAIELLNISEHFVQFCFSDRRSPFCHQWFLYDDLWANANPMLAQSLMRYSYWTPMED